MDLMNLMVRIGADTKGAEKGISSVRKMGNTLAKGLKTAAKGAGIAIGAAATAVGILTKSAVDAYGRYEQLVGGVETLYKTSADKVQTYAKQAYKTAGLSANDYMELATSFAASLVNSLGGDTEKAADMADMAISDMSDNVNKMGSSMEAVQNAYNGFAKGNYTMLDNLKLGYGGTKDEMDRLIKDAERMDSTFSVTHKKTKKGADEITYSYADIVQAIHIVQNEMGITGTTADEADKTIQGSLAATKAAWENVITAIAGGNIDLQESIDALVTSGINTINNIWPVISNALSGIADLVKAVAPIIAENLPGMIQEVLPKLLDAAITLLGGVAQALPGLFKVVLDAIGTLFTDIKAYIDQRNPELGKKIDDVADFFVNAWTVIKNYWNNTLKPAFEALRAFVVDTVAPAIQTAWQNVKTKIDTVFTAIKTVWEQTLKPAFEAIYSVLKDKLQGAFETVTKAINGDKDSLDKLKNTIDVILPVIGGLVGAFIAYKGAVAISTLIDAVRNSTSLLTIAQGLLNKVMNANPFVLIATLLGSLVTAFITAYETNEDFRNKVNAAWASIKQKAEDVWNAVTGWVNDFIAKIQSVIKDAPLWGAKIISNFYTELLKAWNLVKDTILGLWDNITNKVKEIWTGALEWGHTIFTNFKTSVQEGWDSIKQWFSNLWEEVKAIPKKLATDALNWGKDMIQSFKDGITQKWEDLKEGVRGIGQGIKDFLGFSVPKEGPLSDFDTYAPDMIDLFILGINESMHKITTIMGTLVSNIKAAFKLAGTGAYTEFSTALNGSNGNQLEDAIKNPFTDAYDAISRINWNSLGYSIYTGVTSHISDIRDAYRNAFDFSGMYVKTPHWWVDYWNEISGTYYPVMSVHWYRKAYDNPILFNKPTVLGTAGGLKGFGDGPGGEVVLSEAKLKQLVGGGGDVTNNNQFNIYQRDGEDMEALARRIEDILTRQQNQRKAAFA